jgi:predicted membrane protein
METKNEGRRSRESNFMTGTTLAGLILLAVGGLLLTRQLGVPVPHWIISWPMILIVVGVFMGVRSGFKGLGWAFPLLFGLFFLAEDIVPDVLDRKLLWPIMIMSVGALLLFNVFRRGGGSRSRHSPWKSPGAIDSGDVIDGTAVFGGIDRTVVSKNFQRGEVTMIFGGGELNFTQADIAGKAVLNVTAIFGGAEIVVPPNWKVESSVTAIFGGVEDSRASKQDVDPAKVLSIEGTVIFGGIEIKSY